MKEKKCNEEQLSNGREKMNTLCFVYGGGEMCEWKRQESDGRK